MVVGIGRDIVETERLERALPAQGRVQGGRAAPRPRNRAATALRVDTRTSGTW